MTDFNDTVTAKALVVHQGVHTGPSGPNDTGAIDGSVHVYSASGDLTVGLEGGNGGRLTVNDSITAGAIHVGVGSKPASINVWGVVDNKSQPVVQIVGSGRGDIVLANGDLAEEFDVDADAARVAPGSVVVVSGTDAVSDRFAACDPRVIGVVAGAGRYRPGLVLDHRRSTRPRVPVSLVGKAVCAAVAYDDPIVPGDFLVTSAVGGTAMRAPDRELPRGAVFGRALGFLAAGTSGELPLLLGGR